MVCPNLVAWCGRKKSRAIWVAYSHISPKIAALLNELGKKKLNIEYVGRTERASPAVGSIYMHQKEQQAIIDKVFKG